MQYVNQRLTFKFSTFLNHLLPRIYINPFFSLKNFLRLMHFFSLFSLFSLFSCILNLSRTNSMAPKQSAHKSSIKSKAMDALHLSENMRSVRWIFRLRDTGNRGKFWTCSIHAVWLNSILCTHLKNECWSPMLSNFWFGQKI